MILPYVARGLTPVLTMVCVVPGGQESPVAAWLREIIAEPWEFVHRDTEEEVVFLTTGHRILPEALIGQRLIQDTYEHFPHREWLHVLSDGCNEPPLEAEA